MAPLSRIGVRASASCRGRGGRRARRPPPRRGRRSVADAPVRRRPGRDPAARSAIDRHPRGV